MIRRFGTWPVPVISEDRKDGVGMVLEGPVCKQNQVVGWHTSEHASKLRRFHVAMSGFAFNSTMLWDPRLRSHLAWNSIRHPDTAKQGLQVSSWFLSSDCSVNLFVRAASEMVVTFFAGNNHVRGAASGGWEPDGRHTRWLLPNNELACAGWIWESRLSQRMASCGESGCDHSS